MATTDFIKDLKFDDRGLIPAVAQDAVSGEILMLAYMNEESIKMTLESGHATYFSRSRQSYGKTVLIRDICSTLRRYLLTATRMQSFLKLSR